MKTTRYVEMKHEFPAEMASELEPYRQRVLFVRWLVQMGHLSDWETAREGAETPLGEHELVGTK